MRKGEFMGIRLCVVAAASALLFACSGPEETGKTGGGANASAPAQPAPRGGKPAGLLPPKGVEIGRPLADARKAANAAGFAEQMNKCAFLAGDGGASILLSAGEVCDEAAPVRFITYNVRLDPPRDDADIAAALDREIGSGHVCIGEGEQLLNCAWNKPKKFPKTDAILAQPQKISLNITMRAIADLSKSNDDKGKFDKAFDPLAPAGDLDPLAPGGLALGMDVATASRNLKEAGFVATMREGPDGAACAWRFQRDLELDIVVNLRASTDQHAESCAAGARLWNIDYRKRDMRKDAIAKAMTPEKVLAAWRRALNAPSQTGQCGTPAGAPVNCTFDAPAALRDARSARLAYDRPADGKTLSVAAQLVGTR